MRSFRRRVAPPCRSHTARRDRGAVDVSIQMLFGSIAVIFVMLLIFEVTAFWHTRNVLDEAAAEADKYAAEKAFFRFSLAYLFLHFGALLVEDTLRTFGFGGW